VIAGNGSRLPPASFAAELSALKKGREKPVEGGAAGKEAGRAAAPGEKARAEPAAAAPSWPWIVGGAAVLGILVVALAARGRRGR